ncbi:MBL fold metallo-hydrolase [Leucobacter sp. W1153]|uniref:MBL fold metallo-hydrolase n=1 Tax=Leucobacter sp. W1153 TaxID=3439064 RepID=UPI003F3840D5
MLQPTSSVRRAAESQGTLPEPEELSDGIWSFAVPMDSQGIPFSLCYAIEDSAGNLHLIDPGTDSDENWALLQKNLHRIGRSVSDVESLVATHLHPDHLGLAQRIRAASGARLLLHREEDRAARELNLGLGAGDLARRAESWGVPAAHRSRIAHSHNSATHDSFPTADLLCDAGEILPVSGRDLQVIHTPGHTSGHMCVRDRRERILFTGDHVLPTINSGIGLGGSAPTNQVDDYLSSLEIVAEFDDHVVAPGHQFGFRNLKERCDSLAAHHLQRTIQVRTALEQAPHAHIWELANQLTWSAGWENLKGFMLISALAQTEMHVDFLRSGLAERHLRVHNIT